MLTSLITQLFILAQIITVLASQQPIHDHKMSRSLNVFRQPLALHSTQPMTGFMRNGYCEVPAADYGNHAVAAIVTEEFLDFTAKQGNDLRPIPGMKAGCKWCLCVSRYVDEISYYADADQIRWKEAFDARKTEGDKIVPKVFLDATNEKALNKVTIDDLKSFSAEDK